MGQYRIRAIGALTAFAVAFTAASAIADCTPDSIEFRTDLGVAKFSVEVVDTPETRAQGLMHRTSMESDHGMLFVFDQVAPVAFWMKNTPMSLDIVFINRRGVICSIAAGTTPYSTDQIPSGCACVQVE